MGVASSFLFRAYELGPMMPPLFFFVLLSSCCYDHSFRPPRWFPSTLLPSRSLLSGRLSVTTNSTGGLTPTTASTLGTALNETTAVTAFTSLLLLRLLTSGRGPLLAGTATGATFTSLLLLLASLDGDASTIRETDTTLATVLGGQAGDDGFTRRLDALEIDESASLALYDLNVDNLTESG
jgi:hypothetical protein